ncbi:MAG TPA: hypothetical protein ENJ00_04290 [Phycisphaerales bacterium]|nr:hypothetical protein [Phycisphaerales bacterium]
MDRPEAGSVARPFNDIPDLVGADQPAANPNEADAIFLTPRVLDSSAFEHYSTALRGMIEQTTRESDLLARRAEAAACILERLERFVGSHSDVFERANQLLNSIDDRQDRSQELLGLLRRQTELAEAAGRELERAATERAEAFHARLGAIINAEMDRFEQAQSDLSASAATMRRDLVDRLEELRSRGETMLGALEHRATTIADGVPAMLETAEAARGAITEEAKCSIDKLANRSEQSRDEIETVGGRIQRELDAAARSMREAIAAGSAHRDTIERAAELAIGRAQTGVQEQTLELERLIRTGERAVREHRETIKAAAAEAEARAAGARDSVHASMTDVEARLEELLDRAARAAETAEQARREHTELRSLSEALHGRESELAAHIESRIQHGIAARLEPMTSLIESLTRRLEALEQSEPESTAEPEPIVVTTVKRKPSPRKASKPTTRKKVATRKSTKSTTKKKAATSKAKKTSSRTKTAATA